jgi:hypothetical protein
VRELVAAVDHRPAQLDRALDRIASAVLIAQARAAVRGGW